MTQDYQPKPYAPAAMRHLLKPRNMLLAGMGSGKTAMVLTHLQQEYRYHGCNYPTLVLAPQRVAAYGWPDEAKKWTHLQGLRVSPITGSPSDRKAALKQDAEIYTVNYENIQWLRQQFPKRSWPFRRVVADESTKLKSFRLRQGGIRAQALGEVAHHYVEEWVNLTGTPASNGLQDLWGQMWFVDKGRRLMPTYTDFMNRWFMPMKNGNAQFVTWKPQPTAQEDIQNAIADVCLSIDPRDYFDIAHPIVRMIMVELDADQRKQYRQLEREMFIQLQEEKNATAVNAAALSMKCLQYANGAVFVDRVGGPATEYVEVHDGKIEALRQLVEELDGRPLLVAYHFKPDLTRLLKAFPHAQELDHRQGTIDSWNAGRIPVLLAHPASAGHGLNLQYGGHHVCFFGNWWNLEEHDQIIERLGPVRQMQAGLNRQVFVYYIVTRGTVDEDVIARRTLKCTVQEALMKRMKGET